MLKKISTKENKRDIKFGNYFSEQLCIGDGRVQTTYIQVILGNNVWKVAKLPFGLYVIIFRLLVKKKKERKKKCYMVINDIVLTKYFPYHQN